MKSILEQFEVCGFGLPSLLDEIMDAEMRRFMWKQHTKLFNSIPNQMYWIV